MLSDPLAACHRTNDPSAPRARGCQGKDTGAVGAVAASERGKSPWKSTVCLSSYSPVLLLREPPRS